MLEIKTVYEPKPNCRVERHKFHCGMGGSTSIYVVVFKNKTVRSRSLKRNAVADLDKLIADNHQPENTIPEAFLVS